MSSSCHRSTNPGRAAIHLIAHRLVCAVCGGWSATVRVERMTGLVFPIGLLVGTFHDADPVRHHHEIRLGPKVHECGDHELAAWAFAHGPPDGVEPPWTAAAL